MFSKPFFSDIKVVAANLIFIILGSDEEFLIFTYCLRHSECDIEEFMAPYIAFCMLKIKSVGAF